MYKVLKGIPGNEVETSAMDHVRLDWYRVLRLLKILNVVLIMLVCLT